METLIESLAAFGLPGLMCGALIWYLNRTTNDHKIERAEWTSANKDHVDKFAGCIERNTEALTAMKGELKENRCKMP